jgi:hypothetical protein
VPTTYLEVRDDYTATIGGKEYYVIEPPDFQQDWHYSDPYSASYPRRDCLGWSGTITLKVRPVLDPPPPRIFPPFNTVDLGVLHNKTDRLRKVPRCPR